MNFASDRRISAVLQDGGARLSPPFQGSRTSAQPSMQPAPTAPSNCRALTSGATPRCCATTRGLQKITRRIAVQQTAPSLANLNVCQHLRPLFMDSFPHNLRSASDLPMRRRIHPAPSDQLFTFCESSLVQFFLVATDLTLAQFVVPLEPQLTTDSGDRRDHGQSRNELKPVARPEHTSCAAAWPYWPFFVSAFMG